MSDMESKSEPSSPKSPSEGGSSSGPHTVAGIQYINTLDDRITSKVERMAAMVDDKTLISSLIRENSSRISLIEFKDARADIWQHFRLVQLDGQTLAYAVCVRCLKPVSYKAREGTGGLHRHPCSKAAAASGFLPNGSLPPIAIHPLLAACNTTTTSSLPSSSSACNASSSAGSYSAGSSSSKRKDSQTHHHHVRGSSSGISSKGSSLSSPSSSSPSLSPPATAVPDMISSSSSAGVSNKRPNHHHHHHNNHNSNNNNNNLGPSLRQSSSTSSTTRSSHQKAINFSSPTSSSSQSHNTSSSNSNKNNTSHNSSSIFGRHRITNESSSSNSLTSSQAAMAAALNGNSSLSSLSSIMSPFLMSSLTSQQFNNNFIYANGSIKTDCQAMLLLSDSKSPSFTPVTEQMTDLYERSVLLDLTLVTKNGSLKVHKLAIAAASVVFEEALTSFSNNNSWSPSPESGVASASGSRSQSQDEAGSPAPNSPVNACPSSTVEELDLKDYDLTSVRAMVEFIYYGELNDTDLSVPEVMRLAEYYEIRALKFACAQRMYRNLSPENAIEYLAVAEKCKSEELKTLIPAFISENATRVTSTDAWRETFRDRSDLVANLLGVTATDLSICKKRKNS